MPDFILPSIDPEDIPAAREGGATVIDVRRAAARAASGRALPGAGWVDPLSLTHGHPALDAPRIVFFCVHGHEVSQFATALALMSGVDAVYVRGGFEAMAAAGLPTEAVHT